MEGRAWATRCDARTCDGLRPPRARVGARWSELTEQRKKKSRTVFFFPRPLPTGGLGGSAMALRGSSFPRSPPQGARYTLNTSAPPSLPTNPSAGFAEWRVPRGAAESRDLGRSRAATPRDLGRSRAISEPPSPPHPCSKKGRVRLEPWGSRLARSAGSDFSFGGVRARSAGARELAEWKLGGVELGGGHERKEKEIHIHVRLAFVLTAQDKPCVLAPGDLADAQDSGDMTQVPLSCCNAESPQ